MIKLKQAISWSLAMLLPLMGLANDQTESFDGKYSVFLYVAFIVLVGIFLYLFRLEKKVSDIEKKLEDEQ